MMVAPYARPRPAGAAFAVVSDPKRSASELDMVRSKDKNKNWRSELKRVFNLEIGVAKFPVYKIA